MSGWDWAWIPAALAVILTSAAVACVILGGRAARRTPEPPARDARSPSPAPGSRGEPGNPPPGHRQATELCGCVIEYGPDSEITRRWSCMRRHFPSRPL